MIVKNQNDKMVYSDGETTENKMLDIAQRYPEDTVQDYIGKCSEYTVNNTFSSVRWNILNWYPFKKDADVLEVGAGMGALTGLLCEKAKSVVSVEMSEARASVIKARYSERKNLKIVTEDILKWESPQKFDYVVFIGVLEYADVFLESSNPYNDFIEKAKSFLKPDGVLLFAIENKTGLKYWVGGSEDHLQEPYVGLEGYEQKHTPRTFSKSELEQLLNNVGFKNKRFYYVLPDYKFPEIIATDEYKPDYLNLQKVSFTYSKNSLLTMNEKYLYKDILENNVLDFFANSYLVECSLQQKKERKVIYVSSKGEVKKIYRVSTVLYNDGSIYKIPMHEQAVQHIDNIYYNTEFLKQRGIDILGYVREGNTLKCDAYHGVSAQDYFGKLLRNNDRSGLFSFLEEFRTELVKSSDMVFDKSIVDELNIDVSEYQMGPILEKGFVDLTFYNSFYENGKFIFYDQEWCFDNVPLNFILYYAVNSAYSRLQEKTDISLQEIWNYLNIGKETSVFNALESHIWSKVLYRQTDFYGDGGYCNRFNDEWTVKNKIACLQSAKEKTERELETTEHILKMENQKLLSEITDLQDELNKSEHELNQFKEMEIELRQEILNKKGHIEMLLPAERERDAIVHSKMYKIMRFICHTYDCIMIFPRFIGRNLYAFGRMMTHVNMQELKIAYGYVKNEGIKGAYEHLMRDYHQGELKQIKVDVDEKIYDEITDIHECEVLKLPQYDHPTVSIVIPAYNQFTYTYYCIKSILENSENVSYEVILADDCSNDLTTKIASVVENLIIARTPSNMLFLRNCNNAAQKAKGKYVLFLNNDTQVQDNWLKPLVDLCEKDQTIGMAGSKLVYADGTLQEAGGIIWRDGSGWNYGRNDDATKPEYNYVRDVDYISGASILIRRSLWEELGGFDEYFAPAYCEDSDLAFRVRKAGYRVVYQPLSVVVHFEGKSNGTDLNTGIKQYQVENSIKMKKRWKDELDKQYECGQFVFKARERSQNKKTILVVDHYVPQFDKDAGSKTTIQYLRMFVEKGYMVKFIGDNFYQQEPYTTILQQMGIEVLYGPWYAQHWQEWLLENKKCIDFAYLNRPHITIKYIDFIRENTDIKCIYYGHDLHFLRLQREYELTGDIEKKNESDEWLEKELYIMRKADISYYPSYVEEEAIHKIDATIPVKAITAYVYEQFRNNIPMDFAKREGIVFVGGFGHPPNADAVLWFAKEIYPLIRQKIQMPFYIVGSSVTPEIEKLEGNGIIVKGFVSEEELARLYDTCRLVVVPLRYGAGVKGKVVEALYYGTPMVTTSVGIEGIPDPERVVKVADDAEDFANAVIRLYQDETALAQTVKDYQKLVKQNFSLEAVWNIVKEDFE